jgi:hypothetical protein
MTRRFLSLPVVFATAVYAWMGRLRRATKSEKVLNAEDDLRQSRARRKLRGLPPDHVQKSPAALE